MFEQQAIFSRLTYGNLPYILKDISLSKIYGIAMVPAPQSTSMARLEARISPEIKALLQKAADLEGRTLTDFVVSSVQAEAYRVIERYQTLKLSLEDSEAFVQALLNPPKPNNALKTAARRYKKALST
jgi:uncharacterized protein (DUF1778 family)